MAWRLHTGRLMPIQLLHATIGEQMLIDLARALAPAFDADRYLLDTRHPPRPLRPRHARKGGQAHGHARTVARRTARTPSAR